MGTLTVTYNGKSTDYTISGAPSVTYGGNIIGGLNANTWSGTRILKCAGKRMRTDVKFGSSLVLKTSGKRAKTDIKLTYTVNPTAYIPPAITTGGTFTIPNGYNRVQFFCVGGGGGSGNGVSSGKGEGGGGGGYTALSAALTTSPNTVYTVHIGKGGSYADGEETFVSLGSTRLVSAAGGKMGGAVDYAYTYRDEWSDADGNIYVEYEDATVTFGVGGDGGSGGGAGGAISYYSSQGYGGNGGTNGGNGGAGISTISGDLGSDQYGGTNSHAYPTKGGAGQGSSTTYNGVAYSGGGGGGCMSNRSSTTSSPSTTGLGGETGGGRGARVYVRYSSNIIYSQPTSGTPGTGGGCGGIVYSSSSYGPYNASSFAVTGGSGVVIAKLWEV